MIETIEMRVGLKTVVLEEETGEEKVIKQNCGIIFANSRLL